MIVLKNFGKEYEFEIGRIEMFNKLIEVDGSGVWEISTRRYKFIDSEYIRAIALEIALIWFFSKKGVEEINRIKQFFDYSISLNGEQKGNHFHFSYEIEGEGESENLFVVNMYTILSLIFRFLFARGERFRDSVFQYAGKDGLNNVACNVFYYLHQDKYCFVNVCEWKNNYAHLELRASESSVVWDLFFVDFATKIINKMIEEEFPLIYDYGFLESLSYIISLSDFSEGVRAIREAFQLMRNRGRKIIGKYIDVAEKIRKPMILPAFCVEIGKIDYEEFGISRRDIENDFVVHFNDYLNNYGIYCDYVFMDEKDYLVFYADLDKAGKCAEQYWKELEYSSPCMGIIYKYVLLYIFNYINIFEKYDVFDKKCYFVEEIYKTLVSEMMLDGSVVAEEILKVLEEEIYNICGWFNFYNI